MDGADDRLEDAVDDILAGQSAADAQRVAARSQGENSSFGDAATIAQAAHLEPVGYGETLEAELIAQQAGHDPGADRRGQVVECGGHDVRAHDGAHPGCDRRLEWLERAFARIFGRDGEREVGVDRNVAVAGKVLGTRRHAGALHARHPGLDLAGDRRGVRAE